MTISYKQMSSLQRLIGSTPQPPKVFQPLNNYHHPRYASPSDYNQISTRSIYVMVNSDEIPGQLESMVDIFYLFDGIRYIVGYCLPLKCYVDNFSNAEACRIIRANENVQLYQEHITRYKFHIAPLNTTPVNELEFREMITSSQISMESKNNLCKNPFFMRPSIIRSSFDNMRSVDCSATQFVVKKFKLNINPHLIPIRLPDGIECYIRLDLAIHCQEEYCTEELEFGYYHFREIQRDLSGLSPILSLPPPPLPISSLQEQLSRPPPPLPMALRRASTSSQRQRYDSDQLGYTRKENGFRWKCSQSLNFAL